MKTANRLVFRPPQFALLAETELERLHLAALEVLRRTGIRFYHQGALEMLHGAGASISDGNLVSSRPIS
jgi:trimethylamine:corrinoid methyltransferase-like protein